MGEPRPGRFGLAGAQSEPGAPAAGSAVGERLWLVVGREEVLGKYVPARARRPLCLSRDVAGPAPADRHGNRLSERPTALAAKPVCLFLAQFGRHRIPRPGFVGLDGHRRLWLPLRGELAAGGDALGLAWLRGAHALYECGGAGVAPDWAARWR
jgi:hypothetical protein